MLQYGPNAFTILGVQPGERRASTNQQLISARSRRWSCRHLRWTALPRMRGWTRLALKYPSPRPNGR
jgi:hypothetical protein